MESTLYLPMAIQVVGDDALVNGVGDHKSEHGDEEDAEPTRCVNPRVSCKSQHIFHQDQYLKTNYSLENSILVLWIHSIELNKHSPGIQWTKHLIIRLSRKSSALAAHLFARGLACNNIADRLNHRNESSLTKPSDDWQGSNWIGPENKKMILYRKLGTTNITVSKTQIPPEGDHRVLQTRGPKLSTNLSNHLGQGR